MKFITKNSSHSTLRIGYKEIYIEKTMNKKFFAIQIDNHKNWKNHIDQMIPKLSGACYAIISISHISNIYTSNLVCILPFYYKIRSNFLG